MAKIIKTDNNITTIGMDNGSIKEVRTASLSFRPKINDSVEVYESADQIIISKTGGAKHCVNKISYALFAFFLGGLGAHKFYAGKTAQGFLYLIFCWTFIPGIIAFIEFILALAKEADSNGNICV